MPSSSRSLAASAEGIRQAKIALTDRAWSQQDLADELGISRQPVTKFFTGKRVKRDLFVQICRELGLDWQQIVVPPSQVVPASQTESDPALPLDTLVQTMRQRCHPNIQQQCGQMRLLDLAQPIEVSQLYVEVNILEQLPHQQWLEVADLRQEFNPEADDFERWGLGRVRQARVSGIDAVKQHPRLMVLGKPGSGKTTFLQHLAIECNRGNLQKDSVPIFMRLRDFARDASCNTDFSLFDSINRQFQQWGFSEQTALEQVLKAGKGLMILDALDEVPADREVEVIEAIQQFCRQYPQNQFVIACRIAAARYRFALENFTLVEVADFDWQQIESFARKWFVAVEKQDRSMGLAKANNFLDQLQQPQHRQIRELAVTPILLHLACQVFLGKVAFPANRSRLYEEGLDILLVKWDEAKGVQRDEVYRQLSVPRKKQLLAQIATVTFEQNDYFFEQDDVEHLIAQYLKTLPGATADLAELQQDSEAVLQAIEAQHGLLVERARRIYSFSHLTFQEYFIAREVATSGTSALLDRLVNRLTERRWREVFLLAASVLKTADPLLLRMKQQIDGLVAADPEILRFLEWGNQKAGSTLFEDIYEPAAIRAFYLTNDRFLDLIAAIDPDLISRIDSSMSIDFNLMRALSLSVALTSHFEFHLFSDLISALDRVFYFNELGCRKFSHQSERISQQGLHLDRPAPHD